MGGDVRRVARVSRVSDGHVRLVWVGPVNAGVVGDALAGDERTVWRSGGDVMKASRDEYAAIHRMLSEQPYEDDVRGYTPDDVSPPTVRWWHYGLAALMAA